MSRKSIKRTRAFVFLELMLVVAIIGLLAAIALPAYQIYIVRAQVAESLLAVGEVRFVVNEFYRATGRFPKNNDEAGLARPQAYRGNYFISMTVNQGAVNIELDLDSHVDIQGRWLSIRPLDSDHALLDLAWVCGYGAGNQQDRVVGANITDIEKRYLPGHCQ